MSALRSLLLLAVLVLAACGSPAPAAPPVPTPTPRIVTILGWDPATQSTIDPIRIWDNYQTRAKVVAEVHSGAQVTLIQRDGDGVLVELPNGVRGWISVAFIKELK